MDHRSRQPRGDLRLERLGSAFDQRDHEVVRLRHPGEPILDVEPDLRVIDVRHHEYPGIRPRAFERSGADERLRAAGVPATGWRPSRALRAAAPPAERARWCRTRAGCGPSANRPGSCRIRRRASRAPAAKFRSGRSDPPRSRGEEPFHLAPVLVPRRFQMRDPAQESLVLLAQRVEEVLRLQRSHPKHCIRHPRRQPPALRCPLRACPVSNGGHCARPRPRLPRPASPSMPA